MKKYFLPAIIIIAVLISQPSISQSSKAKEIVSKMTLEEKVKLTVGMGMSFPGLPSNAPIVGQITDKVPGAAGSTYAVSRLGIPNTVVADGPAGLRIQPTRKDDKQRYYATAWPVATRLASTWDTNLVKKVGQAMGKEVKEYGVDIILGPALNIHRNPLGGRNFEYYSEDPVVSGNIAAAMVNGIESNGVGTSIKHYAANNQETNRNQINTIVSQRALREIYLKGFEITVRKSQPWTVMSSYNKINGTYASQEYHLLTTILRTEWGFKGYVMTDWFGGNDPIAQMKAGNDLLMPGNPTQEKAILTAVKDGKLDEKIVTENAERIMNIILQTPSYKKYAFTNKPDLKAHAVIARTAASEGIVLLKNEAGTLPLNKNIKTIAAFGNTSYDFISGGTGSGDVNEAYTVSLVEGLGNSNYVVEQELKNKYEAFIKEEKAKQPPKKFFFELSPPLPEMKIAEDVIQQKAAAADIALITIGRNSGEFQDRKKENDYYLTDAEKQLIKDVAAAFHAKNKKVVVIINSGGVIDVSAWRDNADAIVLAWQGGQEAGNAAADVLSGKVNPSGKLATTFPAAYDDVSSAKNFPGKEFGEETKAPGGFSQGRPSEVTYEEGIYTGYRYYTTFNVTPAYPFGYGLSYTSFKYSNLKLSSSNFRDKITATVEITNTGKVAGKEAVQLYISAPSVTLDKPKEELKSFAKTGLLQPGQKQTISFVISAEDLSSFDEEASGWVAEKGRYTINIGASSTDIRQTANFQLDRQLIPRRCYIVLAPLEPINELGKKKAF